MASSDEVLGHNDEFSIIFPFNLRNYIFFIIHNKVRADGVVCEVIDNYWLLSLADSILTWDSDLCGSGCVLYP